MSRLECLSVVLINLYHFNDKKSCLRHCFTTQISFGILYFVKYTETITSVFFCLLKLVIVLVKRESHLLANATHLRLLSYLNIIC